MVHWYTSDTEEPAPKKAKSILSTEKVVATVFWGEFTRCRPLLGRLRLFGGEEKSNLPT